MVELLDYAHKMNEGLQPDHKDFVTERALGWIQERIDEFYYEGNDKDEAESEHQ